LVTGRGGAMPVTLTHEPNSDMKAHEIIKNRQRLENQPLSEMST
jgi:hypothetical protein